MLQLSRAKPGNPASYYILRTGNNYVIKENCSHNVEMNKKVFYIYIYTEHSWPWVHYEHEEDDKLELSPPTVPGFIQHSCHKIQGLFKAFSRSYYFFQG